MFRKLTAGIALSAAALTGFATTASAENTATKPLKCVGAAEHKAAQASRLQALASELAGLNLRLGVAQQTNNAKAVARIQGHITKVNGRIATVQANQAKFAARCP